MTGGGWETVVTVASLVLALWCAVMVIRARATDWWLIGGATLVEMLVIVQTVLATIALVNGLGPADPRELPTFIGYLLTVVLVLPLGVIWSFVDRTRWGPAVLGVTALVVPVLILRLQQVWRTHHG